MTADAARTTLLYDPVRHIAFSTSGDEGTVSVIAVRDAHDIRVVQTLNRRALKTRWGARLAALDPTTGRLYVPTVEYDPSLSCACAGRSRIDCRIGTWWR